MAGKGSFIKGTVEIIALQIIMEEACYGYEISQRITQYSGDVIKIPEGTLYPTLYKLADKGYIREEKKLTGKRKTVMRVYYHIEESGREYLQEQINEYYIIHKSINKILNRKKRKEDID